MSKWPRVESGRRPFVARGGQVERGRSERECKDDREQCEPDAA